MAIFIPFSMFPFWYLLSFFQQFCFFLLSLKHGTVHCQKQDDGLSVDNQLISVFGVNVVHVWKDTVLV